MSLLEAEAEKLTQTARYKRNKQRQGYRSIHFYHNVFSVPPRSKVKLVAKMLKGAPCLGDQKSRQRKG